MRKNKMYYINNSIYIANIRDMVSVVNDMCTNKFSKRLLLYVSDNLAFIPIEDLERELKYFNINIDIVSNDSNIFELGKSVIIFDDARANNIPYSYYKSIFEHLGINETVFDNYALSVGLYVPLEEEITKYDIDDSTANNIPIDLLMYILSKNASTPKVNNLLYEKLIVANTKMKQEQLQTLLVTQGTLLNYIGNAIPSVGNVLDGLFTKEVTADDYDNLFNALNVEETAINNLLNSYEITEIDLGTFESLLSAIEADTNWYEALVNVINCGRSYYFGKRSARLNYIRL